MEVSGDSDLITRVQTLAQSHLSAVPSQYIQPPENRPKNTPAPHPSAVAGGDQPTQSSIPVIDVFEFDANRLQSSTLLPEIARACSEWGAFQVINHGLPTHLLESMRTAGLSFFNDCPMSEKCRYACDPRSPASEGYGSRMLSDNSGIVLDWRDYFDHHTLPLSRRNPCKWPQFSPNYRTLVEEYSDQMQGLAQKLLGLVSESLGVRSSCIEDGIGGEFYQNITVSYYPPCPQPELTLGLQSHSDFGAITLLIQDDVGGLQVFKDGDWVTVEPISDAVVVILADQTEIITNGAYKSAQHRAITNAKSPRLSVATFHDPAKTAEICPAPELVSRHSAPRYRPIVYGEYVSSWYTKGPEGKRNLDALVL